MGQLLNGRRGQSCFQLLTSKCTVRPLKFISSSGNSVHCDCFAIFISYVPSSHHPLFTASLCSHPSLVPRMIFVPVLLLWNFMGNISCKQCVCVYFAFVWAFPDWACFWSLIIANRSTFQNQEESSFSSSLTLSVELKRSNTIVYLNTNSKGILLQRRQCLFIDLIDI